MAGIGFELRKLLRGGSYLGLVRAYGYAGLIGSGPWVLSIVGVLATGLLSVGVLAAAEVEQFLVSVTWLMAGSLILTGVLQLLLSRFIADRLFEHRTDAVIPNLVGALVVISILAAAIAGPVLGFLFDEPPLYRVLMFTSFVLLCDLWILVVLLSGLKAYRAVVLVFLVGYGLSVGASLALRRFGLPGLLGGFLVGQAVIFAATLALVVRSYPTSRLVAFDFLDRRRVHPSLAFTGLFYCLGIWLDKLLFWENPLTSDPVIGPLRASALYDLPIFVAYLSIIPGMAVFLVRVETDFVEHYDAFYGAVRGGDTLDDIGRLRDRMVESVRQGIYEIFKIQGITVVLLYLAGPWLLPAIGISPFYLQLYDVDLVGVGVQVLLLAVLNVLFYLDQRRIALLLTLSFAIANAGFTLATFRLGPDWYGYGFAGAVSLAALAGLLLLGWKLEHLEYETFMLQR